VCELRAIWVCPHDVTQATAATPTRVTAATLVVTAAAAAAAAARRGHGRSIAVNASALLRVCYKALQLVNACLHCCVSRDVVLEGCNRC
jgi:hypothetical protein